ncbi:MAG: restriction endonuclease S subunit [Cenarchaeum symbiont of Oopsacas minuta]|nr:restriction endonuclease S subunit [Cenarchaeum symbiont of Oopsacas minuta]
MTPDLHIKKLSEVCKIYSGGTPSTKNKNFWNGNICWLSSGETRNTFITDTERKITMLGVKNSTTRLAQKFDVVVATAGQGNTRGQVSLCLINTYVNQSVIVLRANNTTLLPKFFFYNLKSRYNELRQLSDSHSSRGSLPKNILSTLNIKLFTLLQQTKIGKIFYDLDQQIENLQNQNKVLEQMAQAIFKSWFVDFDGITKFEYSELGKIPKGWKIKNLEELCTSIQNGGTPKRNESDYWKNGTIEWYKTGELCDSFLMKSKEKITKFGLEKSSTHIWPERTILIAIYAHPVVGRLGILTKPSCSNQACTGLIPKTIFGTNFLFFSIFFTRHYFSKIASGTAQQNISQNIVKNHKIIVPPIILISKFNNTTDSLLKKIKVNKHNILTLTIIRNTLLPKLMSGEIRV